MDKLREQFAECYRTAATFVEGRRALAPAGFDPRNDRQGFFGGPYIDPPIANLTTLSATTIEDIWSAATYTPIFANDPKAGKIYCVRAGGTMSQSAATNTLIITPKYGTGGTALGASPAQTMPITSVIPWYLAFDLVFRTIGAPGANSTCIGTGCLWAQGTIATAGTGICIPFGGTVATVDASINSNIEINMTWSGGTISTQPHFAYI